MYCFAPIALHLLRSIVAIMLLACGFFMASIMPIFIVPALIGSMLLLRGCPLCWAIELFKKIKKTSPLKSFKENPQ